MSKIFRVKLVSRSGEERWLEVDVAGKAAVKVSARDLQKIEILSKLSGFAPDVIKARRVGSDLHLDLMEQSESIEHLIIEDYYSEAGAAIQGLSESQAVYGYMPITGDPGFRIGALVDGVSSVYALGSGGFSGGALGGIVGSAFPMATWGPALGGVALAGAASQSSTDELLPLARASISDAWTGSRQLVQGEATTRLPTLQGLAPANATKVEIFEGDQKMGEAVVTNGQWTFTADEPWPAGVHQLRVRAVNEAQTSSWSDIWPMMVADGSTPVVALAGVLDDVGLHQGALQQYARTDDTQPTVTGTGQPGAWVTVWLDGEAQTPVLVDWDGQWRLELPVLSEGEHSLFATSTNADGETGPRTGEWSFHVDTTAPSAVQWVVTDDVGASQGVVGAGGETDDATPTVSGVGATPGDLVLVQDGQTPIGSAVVAADGSWSVTPTVALSEGAHTLNVVVQDPAGNQSPASSQNITVNTSAQAVAVTRAEDNTDPVQGHVALGGVTNDTTPTMVGTGRPGEVVTISVGAQTLGSATVQPNGEWRFDVPATTPDGSYTYTAQARDAQGNPSQTDFTLTIDTTAPAAPSLGGISDDVGTVQGTLSDGDATDDTTPTFSGTGATPGEIITVYDNGQPLASVVVGPSGAWSVTPAAPGLSEGPHAITLTATDAAGNESQPSAAVNITVDTTAPDAPDAPAQADDDVGPDTGVISQNSVTDDSRPEFSGTAPLGAQTVRVYDNGVLLGTTTVDPQTRAWSFTPETPLADGAHIIRVAPVDAAGNIGAPGPDLNFEVRGDIPGVPAITGVSDNVEGITGAIQKDQRTNDTTPTISGTGVPASTIVVSVDGTVAGSTTVDANGRWSFTPSTALAEGAHTFTAVAQMGGLTSAATGAFPFVVDTSAPNAPAAVVITDDQGAQTGTVTGGQSTDDATPTFSGSGATPGDVITVLDNGRPVASAVVQADGSWSVTPTQPLRDGPHSITLTATDAAGNTSQASTPVAITVDTRAAGVQVYHAIDDVGGVSGEVADGGRTNDTTPTLVGRAEAGAVVTITEGGTTLGSAVADLGGRWQVSLPNQSATGHTYTATAVGASGTSSTSFALTIDTTAPAAPTLGGINDDVGTVQGALSDTDTTDDTTPTFSGTGATPGEIITVYDNGQPLASVVVGPSGAWSVTPAAPGLSEGPHAITLTATDAAGNESQPSAAVNITVDTTAPDAPSQAAVVKDDVGIFTGDLSANAQTDDTRPALLVGTLPAGVTPVYLVDGMPVDATYDSNTGLLTPNDPIPQGQHALAHAWRDPAGNTSAPSPSTTVTIDTQAPATTTAITGLNDNAAPSTGNVPSGGVTNDTTPALSGTISTALVDGQTLRVYDGATYLGNATVNGTDWSFNDNRGLSHGATPSYTARVTDVAGNMGTANVPYTVTIDTEAPTNATTTITPANVTADNIVNDYEVTAGTTLSGQVSGHFREGDVITLTVNDVAHSTTVNASGAYSVLVGGANILADSDRTVDISLQASDAAGNVGTVTATKSYLINTAPVDADETIGATEGAAFTAVDLLDNATDVDSDTLAVTVNSTTGTYASLVSVVDGELLVNTSHASLNTLAAGQTSQVIVNYTVNDGRGGSNTSTATVTLTGVNDAPTTASTAIGNDGGIYSTRSSTALSITDIDATPASGGPREDRVPTGCQALTGTTPDLNDYDNNAWKGVLGFDEFYVQSQVNGRSTDEGEFIGLVATLNNSGGVITTNSEGVFTTMSNLTVGTVYTVAVQWQQAVLTTPTDTPVESREGYYGGQLRISTTGEGNGGRAYTSAGVTDGWQTALYTFTARNTSQAITLSIDGANGADSAGANYKGGYIVVDSLVATAFETQTYVRSDGITVSTLFPASNVTDADDGSSLRGYAITSAANGSTGGWEYSPNDGASWFSLSGASLTNALYLAGTDRVRYTGLRGSNTQLDVVLVDDTGPALHVVGAQATTINVTTRGGTTAFSADVVTLAANAAPVLLDLDGDGRISYSVIDGDINVDGLADTANWVAANDGILFHDKFGDGQLHSMDQFAFAQYGGDTDLEGLAIGFDSNKDGVFDARDAAFDAFQVWQDLNQDGKVDGGELNSLLSLGITSIALNSDGAERSPVEGVTEHGHTQATLANGGSMLVVDASLDYQHGADLQAQAEADRLKAASIV